MSKKSISLLIVCAVMILFPLTASGAGSSPADWIDLGVIRIPPDWSYQENDPEDPAPFSMEFNGKGASSPIQMAVWSVTVGDLNMITDEFSSRKEFTFDDGRSGYMLEGHLFEAGTLIVWLQPELWIALSLYNVGNDLVFTENEGLILSIAKTLTGSSPISDPDGGN